MPMPLFLFRYTNRKYHFVNLRDVIEIKETHFYEIIYDKILHNKVFIKNLRRI